MMRLVVLCILFISCLTLAQDSEVVRGQRLLSLLVKAFEKREETSENIEQRFVATDAVYVQGTFNDQDNPKQLVVSLQSSNKQDADCINSVIGCEYRIRVVDMGDDCKFVRDDDDYKRGRTTTSVKVNLDDLMAQKYTVEVCRMGSDGKPETLYDIKRCAILQCDVKDELQEVTWCKRVKETMTLDTYDPRCARE